MNIGKGTAGGQKLIRIAKRINDLDEQIKGYADEIKELKLQIKDELSNAAADGYTPAHIRRIAKELAMTAEERGDVYQGELELGLYRHAVGLVEEPPAGVSATDDDVSCTVRVNGGPEVSLETAQAAVRRVKPRQDGNPIAALGAAIREELAAP